jgi:hypothetical protein
MKTDIVKKCRSKNDNFGFLLKKFRIKKCWILGFPKRPKTQWFSWNNQQRPSSFRKGSLISRCFFFWKTAFTYHTWFSDFGEMWLYWYVIHIDLWLSKKSNNQFRLIFWSCGYTSLRTTGYQGKTLTSVLTPSSCHSSPKCSYTSLGIGD